MWTIKKTISHERVECIGCGSCALLAPNQRSMDENDGKACLKWARRKGKQYMVAEVDVDDIPANLEAQNACPVNIIQVSR